MTSGRGGAREGAGRKKHPERTEMLREKITPKEKEKIKKLLEELRK